MIFAPNENIPTVSRKIISIIAFLRIFLFAEATYRCITNKQICPLVSYQIWKHSRYSPEILNNTF